MFICLKVVFSGGDLMHLLGYISLGWMLAEKPACTSTYPDWTPISTRTASRLIACPNQWPVPIGKSDDANPGPRPPQTPAGVRRGSVVHSGFVNPFCKFLITPGSIGRV